MIYWKVNTKSFFTRTRTISGWRFFKSLITETAEGSDFLDTYRIVTTYFWSHCTLVYIHGAIVSCPSCFTQTGTVLFVACNCVLNVTIALWLAIKSICVSTAFCKTFKWNEHRLVTHHTKFHSMRNQVMMFKGMLSSIQNQNLRTKICFTTEAQFLLLSSILILQKFYSSIRV